MNKKIILLLIAVTLSTQLFSQSFKHFPDSATWNIRYHYGHPPYYYATYELLGDSIIGAYTYKKLVSGNILIALIREDTVQNKVYAKVFQRTTFSSPVNCTSQPAHIICRDTLLFDYNHVLGDTLHQIADLMGYDSLKVVCMDSAFYGGSWRKQWSPGLLSNSSYSPPCDPYSVIIEGIGTSSGLIETMGLGINGERSELMCFGTPSQTIYPSSTTIGCVPVSTNEVLDGNQLIGVFPNPASDNLIITTTSHEKKYVNIYNSLGKKIFNDIFTEQKHLLNISTFAKGIYFTEVRTHKAIITKLIVKQ